MAKDSAEETYISGEAHQALHRTHHAGRQITIQTRWIGGVLAALMLCSVSFWGGTIYQRHHAANSSINTSKNFGSGGRGFDAFGGRSGRRMGSFGQVTAISSTSITITNQRTNAATTYAITSTTAITDNGQPVTASAIQTGDTVLVMVASGSSMTASRILVNPSFGGGAGGAFGGTSAPADPGSAAPVQAN